ncbi:MAG: coat protein [Cressdnaviricota sp.]|nr:MAG: coat protein [Cressdnaviricota sp.]
MPKGGIRNKRRANKRAGNRMSFAQRVLSVVNKTQETKKAVYETPLIGFDGTIQLVGDMFRIIPPIAKGDDSWERVGQSIRLMKVVVRGYYTMKVGEAASGNSRINARHFFLKSKQNNDYRDVAAADVAKLLEAPVASGQPFNGTAQRYMTPVNRDQFTVRGDNKFKMGTNVIYTSTAGNLAETTQSVKYFTKTFSFGKNGKKIVYEDETTNTPINFPYFHSLGYCKSDGGVLPGTDLLQMSYTSTAYYKDA